MRSRLLCVLACCCWGAAATARNASAPRNPAVDCRAEAGTDCQLRHGPADQSRATYETWLAGLRQWADAVRADFQAGGYDFEATYGNAGVEWVRGAFVVPQSMIHDSYLYDREEHRWTVDRFVDDLEARYGGVHGVLLWPFYTNGGIDDRNQFDFLTSLPGGMAATRAMVTDFHRRGVRVLWPLFPWDTHTRNTGHPHYADLIALLKEAGMDGLNGDTCNGVNGTWWDHSVEQGHPLVLEPQSMRTNSGGSYPDHDGGFKNLAFDVATWGERWGGQQGESMPYVPYVSAFKAIDSRHMVHVTARHAQNRTNDMQVAWFNGAGYNPWESVWCMWNTLTPRDAQALKRLQPLYNAYGRLLQGTRFEPHVPVSETRGVFASEFGTDAEALWTVVNRGGADLAAAVLSLPCRAGDRFYDVYHGAAVPVTCESASEAEVRVAVEQGGFGMVLRVAQGAPPPPEELLARMRQATAEPLAMYSAEWRPVGQRLLEQPRTAAPRRAPRRAALVEATEYRFRASGNQPGGNIADSIDVQMPWEAHPQKHHDHTFPVSAFYVDITPVTNAEYAAFLATTGWSPAEEGGWVKHWVRRRGRAPAPAPGDEERPVVWVSRGDALAYCNAQGKRLPEVWEWQLAAEGAAGRRFPWGDAACPSCHPALTTGRVMPPPAAVHEYPTGASPYGALDMWGNKYEWTSEFRDAGDPQHHGHTGHSARALLKGATRWRPDQRYYFPFPADLHEHNVYLLHSDSVDRSGNIGFRCVQDA